MSLFGTIMSKIFHHPAAQASQAPTGQGTPGAQQGQYAPGTTAQSGGGAQQASGGGQAAQSAGGANAGTAAQQGGQSVDVEAVLNDMARNNPEKLNWRTSIVDLMKLVGLDSSLTARKNLAQELHYTGDTNDSATMNIWLHTQVMSKLAENGGKVPADLRHRAFAVARRRVR